MMKKLRFTPDKGATKELHENISLGTKTDPVTTRASLWTSVTVRTQAAC